MKKFIVNIDCKYEVECESEDDVLATLEDDLGSQNMTAENEFWDNASIEEIKDGN